MLFSEPPAVPHTLGRLKNRENLASYSCGAPALTLTLSLQREREAIID